MFKLAEVQSTSDVFSSRLGRRSPRAPQLPTLSPRSAAPEGICSARSRACPLEHSAPSRTPSFSFARKLTRAPVPRRPSSSRSRIALLRARAVGPLRGSSTLVRPGVSLPRRALARRVRALALDRARPRSMSFDGGARQARSPSPHGGLDAPLARLTCQASFAMGTANASDPGRHRPMSATHDSVFKTGTLRPGTLHSVFPHLAVARASRRYSQPRRSRLRHEGVVFPRSISARTEHASSPAGSPAERDSSRPPALPAALVRRSVFEHGAAPRWSRPASPGRVNDLGSVDGPKHLWLLSHVSPPR